MFRSSCLDRSVLEQPRDIGLSDALADRVRGNRVVYPRIYLDQFVQLQNGARETFNSRNKPPRSLSITRKCRRTKRLLKNPVFRQMASNFFFSLKETRAGDLKTIAGRVSGTQQRNDCNAEIFFSANAEYQVRARARNNISRADI